MIARLTVFMLIAAPALAQESPPTLRLAPGYTYVQPPPTLASLEELARSGREKRIGGAVLIATGSTLAVIGTGLLIAGASDESSCAWYYDDYSGTHHKSCVNGTLTFAGGTTLLVGIGMAIPGAIIYASGNRDRARARALGRILYPTWTF